MRPASGIVVRPKCVSVSGASAVLKGFSSGETRGKPGAQPAISIGTASAPSAVRSRNTCGSLPTSVLPCARVGIAGNEGKPHPQPPRKISPHRGNTRERPWTYPGSVDGLAAFGQFSYS